MKTRETAEKLGLNILCMPSPDKEVTGGYTGDLLSWVMGRASEGDAWITIMTNVNIVAVASLADVACVILAESQTLEEDVLSTAQAKGINVLSSDRSAYDIALALGELLK